MICIVLLSGVLALINKDKLEFYYLYITKSIDTELIIEEAERSYEVYKTSSPENAIRALGDFKKILEIEIDKFKYWDDYDSNIYFVIDRETLSADLSLTHGRIAIKQKELGNIEQYNQDIVKAHEYLRESSFARHVNSADDVLALINRIDKINE